MDSGTEISIFPTPESSVRVSLPEWLWLDFLLGSLFSTPDKTQTLTCDSALNCMLIVGSSDDDTRRSITYLSSTRTICSASCEATWAATGFGEVGSCVLTLPSHAILLTWASPNPVDNRQVEASNTWRIGQFAIIFMTILYMTILYLIAISQLEQVETRDSILTWR